LEHTDHHWYVVRISGHATRVSRRRIVFAGPRGGTHQFIVPDIDQKTNIEIELDKLDLEYFIPFTISEHEDRRKRGVMVTLRRPVLPGYAFVRCVRDWRALEEAAGVMQAIRDLDNVLVRVPNTDIHVLRMIEWDAWCEYVDPPKDRTRRQWIEGSRRMIRHKATDTVMAVTVLSVSNRNRIKAIADKLGRLDFSPTDVDDLGEAA
jgi:transcription antitermination factor NusG